MKLQLCYECMRSILDDGIHRYFITIKPPPDEKYHVKIVDFINYLHKKDIDAWIVKCQSPGGYIHYHGLLNFPKEQSINNNLIKAVQRKVNRDMGFFSISPVWTTIKDVYKYIRADNNTNEGLYEQEDYFYNIESQHCLSTLELV